MRVLIVGCGYVGVPLGEKLAQEGHQVWGIRRSQAGMGELESAGITPIAVDITDSAALSRLPNSYEWVVNCVSAGSGAGEYERVYLEGTRHLLRWLEPGPIKKFIYTSSTSVYAQTDGSTVDEKSPTEPHAATAQVLVKTEQVLLDAVRHGFPAVILRLAGIYGPNRGYWFKRFFEGDAVIEGKGERILNMVHRDDAAGAIAGVLISEEAGGVYNIVDNEPSTQLAFFQFLSTKSGRPLPPFTSVEKTLALKRGSTNKRVSNRRLREELGYQFKYPSFREGLQSMSL